MVQSACIFPAALCLAACEPQKEDGTHDGEAGKTTSAESVLTQVQSGEAEAGSGASSSQAARDASQTAPDKDNAVSDKEPEKTSDKTQEPAPREVAASNQTAEGAADGWRWPVLGSLVLLAFLSLSTLVTAVLALARLGKISGLLQNQAARFESSLEHLRSGLQNLQRTLGSAAARSDGDLPDVRRIGRENSPVVSPPERRDIDPSREDVEAVLQALVVVAAGSESVGDLHRLRLDLIAQQAGRSLGEVRQLLARFNTYFSGSQDPVLRRQNFLSIMESRSDTPGASSLVASLSEEALKSLQRSIQSPR